MSQTRSVDDLLVKVQAEQSNSQAPVQAIPEVKSPDEPQIEPTITENTQETVLNEPKVENETEQTDKTDKTDNKPATTEAKAEESPIDEYGNPIEKPKMYSEEEVQRMIRDRLSRGRQAEQATSQQVQQAAKDFQADPNSEESWETQLETFIDKTIEKRQTKQAQRQWEQEENQRQQEFQDRFTTGMSKYQDFHQVIAGKPITHEIMLAARGLDNPAAFIYGAAKLHPQELERISRIADPYTQAAEVGRLHERMVKTRNTASKAGKPLEAPKSDMATSKDTDRPSIDALIRQHEQTKFRRK